MNTKTFLYILGLLMAIFGITLVIIGNYEEDKEILLCSVVPFLLSLYSVANGMLLQIDDTKNKNKQNDDDDDE